jgi:apolipoprotein N-acyltransferase
VVPVLWTAQELLRTHLFTGFPWELLGYSQFERIPLIQIADIAGVYGVSFLAALVNAALYALWQAADRSRPDARGRRRRAGAACAFAAVFLAGAWFYGTLRIDAVDSAVSGGKPVRVALIQGNIAQEMKWDRAFQVQTTAKYARLSESAGKYDPHLVVWPETATPFYFPFHGPLSRIVFDAVKRTGADFLIGSPSFLEKSGKMVYFNSAYLIDAGGTVKGRYDKVHLVPFGEYVPFKRYLPFLGKMVEHVGDFQAGPEGQTLAWRGSRLGVLICYESIFPALSRAQTAAGADILVNITNDAWYGRSSAPFQHFSMAVFRAVENRRPLVRAANTGISGFIDAVGRVAEASPLFTDAVMAHTVRFSRIDAPYTRLGDTFAGVCLATAVLIVFFSAMAGRMRRK